MSLKNQYIYVLNLVERLLDESNWTDKENSIVDEHFNVLQNLLEQKKLILAGRTLNYDPFGIVILEVGSEEEARSIMENDPAVRFGVMTAELYPYRVALSR
jgi:uncharacterized protein YciI